jgi:hypothetical protein
MFSLHGQIIKGYDRQKALLLSVSEESYNKILQECKIVSDIANDPVNQPLYPAWKYEKDGVIYYYAKMFLSKARKDRYETLKYEGTPSLYCVRAMPYQINNANSATVDGISLYFQDIIRSETFQKQPKEKKVVPPASIPDELEPEYN